MNSLAGIDLQDLVWPGEFDACDVETEVETTLGGRRDYFDRAVQGREITLSGTETSAWFTRADMLELQALANQPGQTYELVFNGQAYTVRFRTWDLPCIQSTPLRPSSGPQISDKYHSIVLKLQTV